MSARDSQAEASGTVRAVVRATPLLDSIFGVRLRPKTPHDASRLNETEPR